MIHIRLSFIFLAIAFFSSCQSPQLDQATQDIIKKHPAMRAAWVATVASIDWPSQTKLTIEEQKAEARELLDLAVEINLNTVIFQVRPHGDAFYKSKYEPWSHYLSGVQGQDPGYDPLAFWLEEAHKRGLKLHAWFNPYRIQHPAVKGDLASNSLQKSHPEWSIPLKEGYVWLNPANTDVQNHFIKVLDDCLSKYSVDGIHMDDYFYPYKDFLGDKHFPDHNEYQEYLKYRPSPKLDLRAWRRKNVNSLVYKIHQLMKSKHPKVEFGISPFGIWHPGYPSDVEGTSSYNDLACDSRLWLQSGWVDYLSPQLYWPESAPQQRFTSLINWWKHQNTSAKSFIPGIASWRTEPKEILRQIKQCNEDPLVSGYIHFSLGAILKNPILRKQLSKQNNDIGEKHESQ